MSIENKYDTFNKQKDKIGAYYKKCVFHLHTPASYDYGLIKKGDAKNLQQEDIDKFIKENNLFNLLDQMDENDFENCRTFKNQIEFQLYCLIIIKLEVEKIKSVVVTDHNTFEGFDYLNKAAKFMKDKFRVSYPVIYKGVEITCSDSLHVVLIIDEKSPSMNKIANEWIEEHIQSNVVGTYMPSLFVFEEFFKMGAIGYIAHFNTDKNLSKKEGFLNNQYKNKLFNNPNMSVIGVNSYSKREQVEKNLQDLYIKKDFNFIVDEDSHTLNEHGRKFMWLKSEKNDFESLKQALNDYSNSFLLENLVVPSFYIKGLIIQGKSFIKNKNTEDFMTLMFSPYMNCLIGGKGTGKSTILNVIDFLLGQNSKTKNNMINMFSQGEMYILVTYDEVDYIISFKGIVESEIEMIIDDLFNSHKNYYILNNHQDKVTSLRNKIASLLQVFELENGEAVEITQKKKLLDKLNTRKYSLSSLVEKIEDTDSINKLLKDMISQNKLLSTRIRYTKAQSQADILKHLTNRKENLEKIRIKKDNIIKDYNQQNKNIIQLKYSLMTDKQYIFKWDELLKNIFYEDGYYLKKYSISKVKFLEYLNDFSKLYGSFSLIQMILNEQIEELLEKLNLQKYAVTDSMSIINNSLVDLNKEENILNFFGLIKRMILLNIERYNTLMRNYYDEVEQWGIEFNINNMSGLDGRKPILKNINYLSMGQKVVALLNFIISFDHYNGNISPLIIDQPEDHLDNRFIYDNLVSKLRDIKHKRQIIIATHNSTIVTNSSTEQVIVMESNSLYGWVERTGYCKNKNITTDIINILEGGRQAFIDKKKIYGV